MASQGKLNIFVVLIVAMLGAEAGGLAGYGIGNRWGRKFLDRPGRRQEQRQKAITKLGQRRSTRNGDVSPSISRRP